MLNEVDGDDAPRIGGDQAFDADSAPCAIAKGGRLKFTTDTGDRSERFGVFASIAGQIRTFAPRRGILSLGACVRLLPSPVSSLQSLYVRTCRSFELAVAAARKAAT